MSEIKIFEKIVAPNASWATVDLRPNSAENAVFVRKVTFNRSYQYFWAWSPTRFGGDQVGIAMTMADIERVAVFDDSGNLVKFDIFADGIMPCEGTIAFCVAMGHKRSFYILSNLKYETSHSNPALPMYISAQDDALCPFAYINPYT